MDLRYSLTPSLLLTLIPLPLPRQQLHPSPLDFLTSVQLFLHRSHLNGVETTTPRVPCSRGRSRAGWECRASSELFHWQRKGEWAGAA